MFKEIRNFLQRAKEQEHILSLIEKTELTILLRGEDEAVELCISNGDVTFHKESSIQTCKYVISGNSEALKQFIHGEERLRTLERKDKVKVQAPLRVSLMLESIFFLAKTEPNRKII